MRRKSKRELRFVFSIVKQCAKIRIVWIVIIGILSLMPTFVSIYGLKMLVDALTRLQDFKYFLWLVVFLTCLQIFYECVKSFYDKYIVPKSNLKIKQYINEKLFNKMLSNDIACYDNPTFYDQYTLGIKDADSTIIQTLSMMEQLIVSILNFLLIVAMIVTMDIIVIIVPMIGLLLTILLNKAIAVLQAHFENKIKIKERFSDYMKRLFYSQSFAKELLLFPIRHIVLSNYRSTIQDMRVLTCNYTKKASMLQILYNVLVTTFSFGLVLFFVGWRVWYYNVSLGDFIGLANASLSFIGAFLTVFMVIPNIMSLKIHIGNIQILMNKESEIQSGTLPFSRSDYDIDIQNVSFAYPFNQEKRIINSLSCKIVQNEKIAIVGLNGSGKSTFVKLLLRLYDCDSGEIIIGGHNIREYDLSAFRSSFHVLFQDFAVFPFTIGENVIMRKVVTLNDEQEVWKALDMAGVGDRIRELPLGINTSMSKEFDNNGVVFSGGEVQKIMLARVFAHNKPILILDEPSSALDPLSENRIFDTIFNTVSDRTTIFITHRLDAAKQADRILLMEDGAIVENGSHEQLYLLDGIYRKMYDLQLKRLEIDPEEKKQF